MPNTCILTIDYGLLSIDTNEELAVMKSNAALSSSSLSSGVDSAITLSDHERKPPIMPGYEAMPSIRARLAKSSGRSPSTVRSAPGAGHFSTPHQNPVQMVQEMVGRVKVRTGDYLIAWI